MLSNDEQIEIAKDMYERVAVTSMKEAPKGSRQPPNWDELVSEYGFESGPTMLFCKYVEEVLTSLHRRGYVTYKESWRGSTMEH